MTRPLATILAILTLVAGQLGVPAAVFAAAPVTVDDSGVVVKKDDPGTTIDVLANDTVDPEATITAVSVPANGTAAIAGNGVTVTYAPDPGYTGLDTFTYTVTDPDQADGADTATISLRVNAPPVAVDDPAVPGCNLAATPPAFGGSFPIPEDWGQFVLGAACGPSANDSDADGTIDKLMIDTEPAHGSLEWDQSVPGFVGYTPDPDWSTIAGDQPGGDWLSDSFTYHVIDNDGASSDTATYRLWIAPVNDAPTFTAGAAVVHGLRGTAYDQPWATSISPGPNEATQTVHFETTSTDLDGNPDLFAAAPTIGADGRLSFTLAPGELGSATITFVAKDDGGLESYSGVTVHPKDTSDPVTFDIVADNSAPSAAADGVTVTEDQPAASVVGVLGNDSDVDSDTLTITATTNGAKGAVTITGGGTDVSYKPNANAFGSDSFTYTIDDGQGGTSIGIVTVTITPVNDPPNAVNDGVPTPTKVWLGAGAQSIPVLANDTYLPDGPETLHVTAVTQGGHGTVAIAGGGTGLTYKPTGTATGIDVFTYTISDGTLTDTASAQVTVARDTTPPTAAIVSIQKSTIPGRSGLRIYVHWSLTETGSGLKSQLFQRRTDSGSWLTVSLGSITTRSVSLALARGHAYTFRVRATDRSGNVGAFASRLIRI